MRTCPDVVRDVARGAARRSLVRCPLAAQAQEGAAATKPAPKAAPQVPLKTVTPDVKCPSLIGMGVKTVRSFCDVPAGRDPAQGIVDHAAAAHRHRRR